jgi:hypothetical protein
MVHARGDGRDDDASERMLGAEPGVPAIGRGPVILGTMRSHDQWNTNVLCPVGD